MVAHDQIVRRGISPRMIENALRRGSRKIHVAMIPPCRHAGTSCHSDKRGQNRTVDENSTATSNCHPKCFQVLTASHPPAFTRRITNKSWAISGIRLNKNPQATPTTPCQFHPAQTPKTNSTQVKMLKINPAPTRLIGPSCAAEILLIDVRQQPMMIGTISGAIVRPSW